MKKNRRDAFLGLQMGDYTLQEVIAVGGMARVYLAGDVKLKRQAAVKVLDLKQDWVDETIVERFEREAHSVARLDHPNIITIYTYGTENDCYFQAMQYIPGQDLRHLLKDHREAGRRLDVQRGLYIMAQVASAIDYANQRGIIHRDIKPSNVLLRSDDSAVLTDFGLVLRNDDETMGTAFGTPRYIAPEQATGSQTATAQSDIYAFAVILYEVLTGDTPFDGETPMEIALLHVNEKPQAPSQRNPEIPKAVDEALLRALSKEPNDRQESAAELMETVIAAYGLSDTILVVVKKDTIPAPSLVPAKAPAEPLTEESAQEAINPTEPSIAETQSGGAEQPLILGLALFIAVIGGIAFFLLQWEPNRTPEDAPTPAETVAVSLDNALVTLVYSGEQFVMHNSGPYTLPELNRLAFVRGRPADGGDDLGGDRIPGNGELAPGACFRITLTNATASTPTLCDTANQFIALQNITLFHWRSDEQMFANFDVLWDGNLLARCDTVRRGESGECTFRYPVPPPEEN